jgi:mTERF domain-containing protein
VFSLNANDKLRRGVKFFQSIGIENEREMEFLFSRNAQIFCCSIERNLKPTFDFFLSIGLEQSIVSKMVVLFPPMLGQNVQRSLAPKYRYLILDMNRSVEELVEFPQVGWRTLSIDCFAI